jgi:hypothetical protein
MLTQFQTYKGWVFVLVSAGLIHLPAACRDAETQAGGRETRKHLVELEAVNKISTALRATQTLLDEMLPRLLEETLAVLSPVSPARSGSMTRPAANWSCSAATGIFTRMSPNRSSPAKGSPAWSQYRRLLRFAGIPQRPRRGLGPGPTRPVGVEPVFPSARRRKR